MCSPEVYLYLFANPKSMIWIKWDFLPFPIKKLSGFTSLCRKDLEWIYSILWIIWSATINTVFSENCRLQKLNRSSREGPSRSMTMQLYSPSTPYQITLGTPMPPAKILYSFVSYSSWGCLVRADSSLTATSSSVSMFRAKSKDLGWGGGEKGKGGLPR